MIVNLDDLMQGGAPSAPESTAPKKEKIWSPQQLAIYEHARQTRDNMLIEAVAGSGKSTTIIELMRWSPGTSLFLAFNKAIAEELRSKVSGGDVRTLNALGHRVLMAKRPGAKLNAYKTMNWLRNHMSYELYESSAKHVARVVSVAKGSGLGIFEPTDQTQFRTIIDRHIQELEPDQIPAIAKLSEAAFHGVLKDQNEFDFDDQLYVPVKENWMFPAYDDIYVDECQDLNPIQHMMLTKLADRGARITGVGDRRQAIYAFRGASSNSMDLLQQTFFMKEFPLSTTYRCSQSVTALAQTIVPQIQHRADAEEGLVENLTDFPDISLYSNSDLIICRNNAPIFDLCLEFIRHQLPCRVLSNFLDQIDQFILSFKAKEIGVLLSRLEAWYQKQKTDCENREAWGKLEGLSDKYEVIKLFAPEFRTVNDMLNAIRRLGTSTQGPRISTIHKAKGLEADNVYLLRWDLLPSPRATSDEAITQEDNLRYVAITRARTNLRILPMEE